MAKKQPVKSLKTDCKFCLLETVHILLRHDTSIQIASKRHSSNPALQTAETVKSVLVLEMLVLCLSS